MCFLCWLRSFGKAVKDATAEEVFSHRQLYQLYPQHKFVKTENEHDRHTTCPTVDANKELTIQLD